MAIGYTEGAGKYMKIHVNGGVLGSLRTRYKASAVAAAHIVGVEPEVWSEWETNGTELSVGRAKEIAKKFHTHWSVFLLDSPVQSIKEPVNHRAGYADNAKFSMETMFAYEQARSLLDASIEIEGQTIDERIAGMKNSLVGRTADEYAHSLREAMGVTYDTLKTVGTNPVDVYTYWKERVSALGVYVSEQSMPETETKAFLLEDGDRAVIVINKNDRYPHSKVFSLLHELGHLVRGDSSAACLVSVAATRASIGETWCNRLASELILPDAELLADPLTDLVISSNEPANIIRTLSTRYRASFMVVMYKLLRHKKITNKQCVSMQTFFESVILPKFKVRVKKDEPIKLGKIFHVRKDISKASVGLSREVVRRQMDGSLSYSDAARLLGTKARYIEDIKSVVGFGS